MELPAVENAINAVESLAHTLQGAELEEFIQHVTEDVNFWNKYEKIFRLRTYTDNEGKDRFWLDDGALVPMDTPGKSKGPRSDRPKPREEKEQARLDSPETKELRKMSKLLEQLRQELPEGELKGRITGFAARTLIDTDTDHPKLVLGAYSLPAVLDTLGLSKEQLGLKRIRLHPNLPEEWVVDNPQRIVKVFIAAAKAAR